MIKKKPEENVDMHYTQKKNHKEGEGKQWENWNRTGREQKTEKEEGERKPEYGRRLEATEEEREDKEKRYNK